MPRDWNRSSVDWSQVNQPTPRARRKIARVTSQYPPNLRLYCAGQVVDHLETALIFAKKAGAPYTTERVRLALSSARGAHRNAGYRVTREKGA